MSGNPTIVSENSMSNCIALGLNKFKSAAWFLGMDTSLMVLGKLGRTVAKSIMEARCSVWGAPGDGSIEAN